MLGVVTGLRFEADIVRKAARKLDVDAPLMASVAGDQEQSYEAAKNFIDQGVKGLVSFGIAGGLTEALPVGSLVLPKTVLHDGKSRFSTDGRWRKALAGMLRPEINAADGPLISLSIALETEDDKRAAHRRRGAVGVDMESHGVARAAHEAGVPFIVIRAISDAVEDQLPASVVPAMGAGGAIRPVPLVKGILKDPSELSQLADFGKKTAKANATLRRVCFLGLPLFGLRR